jgi:Mycobacterium membrane protein
MRWRMARPGIDTSIPPTEARYDAANTAPEPTPTPGPPRPQRPKRRKWSLSGAAKRIWILLVIAAVVAISAFVVFRLHGVFGKTETTRPGMGVNNDPKPFNPKTVTYEIFGVPGAVATINYLDLDAQPQHVVDVTLPWSLTLTTTAPAAMPNIIAQSDGDTITCRVTVDGVVKDERTVDGLNAQTFCLVKSA